ncbi:MAG: transcription antitermination factor NusB [Bacteroidetes bacterium]|nr:transcription antitermination factor NusB [Bacteroidota bacterium]
MITLNLSLDTRVYLLSKKLIFCRDIKLFSRLQKFSMLARRNLRIKAFQTIFSGRAKGETEPRAILKEFNQNIDLFEKFYCHLLMLPSALAHYLLSEKDFELSKYFPDKEKIRESSFLEDNLFVSYIDSSEPLEKLLKKSPYDWKNHGELLEKIFKELKSTDFYRDYLVFDSPNAKQQEEFLLTFYGYLFETCTVFQDEVTDIYYNWDYDVFSFYQMLSDSLKNSFKEQKLFIQKIYKDEEEDYDFVKVLIERTTTESQTYQKILREIAKSWDTERIAKVDIILMEMAMTEFLYFPTIPLKVTINEYIDLAKSFSTDKSHIFINGVLDKTKDLLLTEGKIKKEGRGLRDN